MRHGCKVHAASLRRSRRDVLLLPAASVAVPHMRGGASSLKGPSLLFSELKPRPLGGAAVSMRLTSFTRFSGRTTRLGIRLVNGELAERMAGSGRRLHGVGGGTLTRCRRRVFARFLTHLCVAQFPRLLQTKCKVKHKPHPFTSEPITD